MKMWEGHEYTPESKSRGEGGRGGEGGGEKRGGERCLKAREGIDSKGELWGEPVDGANLSHRILKVGEREGISEGKKNCLQGNRNASLRQIEG